MVGGGNNEAFGIVYLDELQEAVQDAADLASVIGERPLRPDCIELVE